MQMINEALLVTLLIIAGTFCQKIVFDNTTFISPCTTSARSGIDRYFITGTIGENITELLAQKWQPFVFIRALRTSSSQFNLVCQFIVRGAACVPSPAASCGCFYNITTDQAHFTANNTVQEEDSNAIIRAQWQHTNGTSIYSNTNYTLQEIYDVNAGHLTLTVAGVTGNLITSGSCSFSLTLNKSNDLELCCSNTAKPCYPQISFKGAVVTQNTEMCVTYPASQLASDGVTGNLDLSYSVCTRTDYIQGNNCAVIPKPTPPDDNKCKIICPAVIVPVVVVNIHGVSIAAYFYKTKKRSKAVFNHGTNENTDKAKTRERHKRDRQYREHANRAYDGRRSSPRDVTINGVKTATHDHFQQHNTVQEEDGNKPISGRTNDGSASQTVPGNPRRLPPLKRNPHPWSTTLN